MKKNAFLFLLSFILISCESEEVVVDEEHTDADGFILEYNEEEVYKEFAGAIVTNNVTVARNGSNMDGATSDFTISTNGFSGLFIYMDSTKGWSLINESNTILGS